MTIVSFVLTHLVPGDPVLANLGEFAINDPRAVAAFEQKYGLDKPLPVQYVVYVERLVNGDLGQSQTSHRSVRDDLSEFVPATIELGVSAMAITLVIGLGLGLLAAAQRESILDQVIRLLSLAVISMPVFWLGVVALYYISFRADLLPGSGRLDPGLVPPQQVTGFYILDALLAGDLGLFGSALQHLILPACVLAAYNIGFLARFARSALLEVSDRQFVMAARAKGLSPRIVLTRHVLRAALSPIVTVFGLLFANVITGTVLVESVFSWPGVGQYAFKSATSLDLQSIMGVSLFIAVSFIVVNFAVDLMYGWIDPRARPS